jgi:hypothetical protein
MYVTTARSTALSRLVASVVFVLAPFRVLLGLAIAREYLGPYEAALARYTTASSSGQMIDYAILLAIGLGTLAEISFSVRKGST